MCNSMGLIMLSGSVRSSTPFPFRSMWLVYRSSTRAMSEAALTSHPCKSVRQVLQTRQNVSLPNYSRPRPERRCRSRQDHQAPQRESRDSGPPGVRSYERFAPAPDVARSARDGRGMRPGADRGSLLTSRSGRSSRPRSSRSPCPQGSRRRCPPLAKVVRDWFRRRRSSVLRSGRRPSSRSLWRTLLRRVSAVRPIFWAIEQIDAHSGG